MHRFTELVDYCAAYTSASLEEVSGRTTAELQSSGGTSLVKALQLIRLQKAIFAVGMFSLFEASLQDGLKCTNGFEAATAILEIEREVVLKESFSDFYLAVNVLKHGRGRSYDALVTRSVTGLPFKIKQPGENFFNEGDVSEISTLIEVDDAFLRKCADVICGVGAIVRKNRHDCFS